MHNWLLSEVWNIKSPNLFIFSTEKIPRILNHQMVQGGDLISLLCCRETILKEVWWLQYRTWHWLSFFRSYLVTILKTLIWNLPLKIINIVSFSEREYFFLGMTKYLSILLRHAVAFVLVTINQKSSTYMYNSLINVTRIYVLIRLDIMK